jgi:hypothetical protein
MAKKNGKLTMTVQFDLRDSADTFGKFCKALLDGGFEDVVRQMAQALLKEAKRRKLPLAAEIEKVVRS